jgi:hypothetical protein
MNSENFASTFKQRTHIPHFNAATLQILSDRYFHDENWHCAHNEKEGIGNKKRP